MSDPAKSPEEIEDVLESVRRLVSDHGLARETNTPEPIEIGNSSDRGETVSLPIADALVLAPSFRVTDPEDPWVPVSASASNPSAGPVLVLAPAAQSASTEAKEDAEERAEVESDILIADVMAADTEGDVAEVSTNWHPEDRLASFDTVGNSDADRSTGEADDTLSEHPSAQDLEELLRLDGEIPPEAEFESETGDDNWPGSGAETALLTLVARREPVLETQETLGDTPDFHGEDQDNIAGENAEAAIAPMLGDTALGEGDEAETPLELAPAEVSVVEHAIGDDDTTGHDATEHASEDISVTGGERESEGEDVTAPAAEREADPEITAEPRAADAPSADDLSDPPYEDLGETASPFTFPETDEGILDEDTLREIIVEIVRDELQGVLGQRITRNVRKMVRREIRLALAAEELE